MRRRDLIVTLGAAAAGWPLPARAQQPAVPLIGLLGGRSAEADAHLLAAFRDGLREKGYVEGETVAIAFRWADGRYELLPALAAELVRLRPAAIVATGGSASALAAKSATDSIPVAFVVGGDPVELGLVRSLNRPDANLTGFTVFSASLDAKRLELLRELVPTAKVVAALINPANPSTADQLRQAHAAAGLFTQELHILTAKSEREIEAAFEALGRLGADALAVASDSFLISRRQQIIALAAARGLPAVYAVREFAEVGGLLSYGTDFARMYRLLGGYAGQILKGTPPADLPVQAPTKFELMINLKTAKALGLTVPPSLLARADEVIE
jgi:putative ABC transport system substrate-binding protein